MSSSRENSCLAASVTMIEAASAAPRPRSRPAGKVARPSASVTALPIGSLPRDSSTTSCVGQRLGAGDRAGEHGEPVAAGEGGEGDVGVHHPHAGEGLAALVVLAIVAVVLADRAVGGQTVSANDRLYLAARVPTLIVWGDRDAVLPVEHGRAAHRAIA